MGCWAPESGLPIRSLLVVTWYHLQAGRCCLPRVLARHRNGRVGYDRTLETEDLLREAPLPWGGL